MAGRSYNPEEGLVRRGAARAVRDNGLAEVAMQVLRLSGYIVLARALLPSDFGVLRVLSAIGMLVALLGEGGIPDALVQRKSLEAEHEASGFWLTVVFSIAVALALFSAASAVGAAMQMPELAGALKLLCIPIIFEGTALVSAAKLRRQLRFGPLAAADVMGEAGFFATALALLWLGFPRWSLAGGLATRYAMHALTIWLLAGYVPSNGPKLSAARDLAQFSASAMGGKTLRTFSANADYLIIGKLLGSTALGFYSMAWDLLQFVPARIYSVVGRVTLPAFCQLQDRDESLRVAYLALIDFIARIVFPIAAVSMVAGAELIAGIYGPKWLGAGIPLRLLAFGLATISLRMGVGSIYYARNHPVYEIYLQGARLAAIAVTVTALAPFGLVAVSLGMSLLETAISVAAQWSVSTLAGFSLPGLTAALRPGLKSAVCCALASEVGATIGERLGMHGAFILPFILIPVGIVLLWLELDSASGVLRFVLSADIPSVAGETRE